MIINPALRGVQGNAVHIFPNRDAERQLNCKPKHMIGWVNLEEFELDSKAKGPRARRTIYFLTNNGRTGWYYLSNLHIVKIAPTRWLREQSPDNINGRIDDSCWTVRILHRHWQSSRDQKSHSCMF